MSRFGHALVALLTVAALMGGASCACAISATAGAHDCCAEEGDVVLAAADGCCGGEAPMAPALAVSAAVGAPSPSPAPPTPGFVQARPVLVPVVPLRSPFVILRI